MTNGDEQRSEVLAVESLWVQGPVYVSACQYSGSRFQGGTCVRTYRHTARSRLLKNFCFSGTRCFLSCVLLLSKVNPVMSDSY